MARQNGKANGRTTCKLTRLERAHRELEEAKAEEKEQMRQERVELARYHWMKAIAENRPLGRRWQRILCEEERIKIRQERQARQRS